MCLLGELARILPLSVRYAPVEGMECGCVRGGFRLLFFPEQPFQESSLPAGLFRGALSGCLRKLSGYFPAGLLLLAHNLLDLQHVLFLVPP